MTGPAVRPGILDSLSSDPEAAELLGDAARVRAMVKVEVALAAVQGRQGVIPADAALIIATALHGFAPDLADLARGTAAAGVPVPALVGQLRRAVGAPAADHLHWGATSQDILDTALVLQLREMLERMEERLGLVCEALAQLARAHRATSLVGRTRFQQAVPTLFGLKVAGWLAPLLRHRERLRELRPRLLLVQLGGAAGNLAALGDRGIAVMEGLAAELGLGCPPMPWHAQRDGMAELGSWLALLTGSLGKLGQDVLLMAQSEIGEMREAEGGGSSTMPQKANPILAEALVTLARHNAGAVSSLHHAMLHAHERDGAAWALEWMVLPGMIEATAAALAHAVTLARSAVIDPARMLATLDATHGLVMAEAVSFALARHMPRAAARSLVEEACAEAMSSGRDLVDLVVERAPGLLDGASLRATALHPPAALSMIDRVLAAARPAEPERDPADLADPAARAQALRRP